MSASGSKRVIVAALLGNLAITAVKAAVAATTGSAALLAEALHSGADTGNQLLLLVGMRLGARRPDERHSFGYGRERYFWPFVVALTMFSLGAIFSVHEGVHKILHPEPPHGGYALAYGILVVSLVIEGASIRVALREYEGLRRGKGFFEAARVARDPTVFVVVFEDAAALVGLVLALLGIGLTHLTGRSFFDALASVAIGVLLGAVAIFLGVETRSLLIGESAVPEEVEEIRRVAGSLPGFVEFKELRTMHLAPDEIVVEAAVKFDESLSLSGARAWIADFEKALHAKNPKITHVTVEPA
ncbi:MAG TPA: cation diffusion facilitator family transporter [Thermoanaerobaculia bacterium]|nr:cation diffusion facilitator family transporter [Thermoanaerobaculia bacterium]